MPPPALLPQSLLRSGFVQLSAAANRSVRHGTCFHRRLPAHYAGAAPDSAVAELGVVRPFRGAFPGSTNLRHRSIVPPCLSRLRSLLTTRLFCHPTSALHWLGNSWTASIWSRSQVPKRHGRRRLLGASRVSRPVSRSQCQREKSLPDCGKSLPTDKFCSGFPPGGVRRGRVRHGRL